MWDIVEEVDDLRCGFDSLKEDVTVLESASSELLALSSEIGTCLEEHDEKTESDLSDITDSVESKKETANAIQGFVHPCGGPGWQEVEIFDFRDSDTSCNDAPIGSELTPSGSSERPYTCQIATAAPATCNTISFSVDGTYNRVCGRVKAYQLGTPNAFFQHTTNSLSINEAYLSGISITHGGELGNAAGVLATHIWSFAAGATQSTADATIMDSRCPCDAGSSSPTFVGEDYFCESAIEEDISGDMTQFDGTFFFRNCLWDGDGCADSSTCCSRIDHPYFIKDLATPTSEDIDLRVCNSDDAMAEDFAIELIELYVQTLQEN